jgi:hypothetical protein
MHSVVEELDEPAFSEHPEGETQKERRVDASGRSYRLCGQERRRENQIINHG